MERIELEWSGFQLFGLEWGGVEQIRYGWSGLNWSGLD